MIRKNSPYLPHPWARGSNILEFNDLQAQAGDALSAQVLEAGYIRFPKEKRLSASVISESRKS